MTNRAIIWILEDDSGARFVYEEILGIRYEVRFFLDLASFVATLQELPSPAPDLIIADLRLPGASFLDFIRSTPKTTPPLPCPFLVVSSVDDLDVLRICFQEGAVDYLTKPFGKGELIVKVERTLKTLSDSHGSEGAPLHIDPVSLTASNEKCRVPLTAKEFQILTLLKQSSSGVLSKEEIFSRVWGGAHVDTKTLDVHLSYLRRKISDLSWEIRRVPPNSYRLCRGSLPADSSC